MVGQFNQQKSLWLLRRYSQTAEDKNSKNLVFMSHCKMKNFYFKKTLTWSPPASGLCRCLIQGCPLSSRSGRPHTRVRPTSWTRSARARPDPLVRWLRWTWSRTTSPRGWWGGTVRTEWLSRWWGCRTSPTQRPVSATHPAQWAQTTTRATRATATVNRCHILIKKKDQRGKILPKHLFVFVTSRTSPPSSCQRWGPRWPRGASARTAQSTGWGASGTTSPWGKAGTRPAGGSCWPSRELCSCRRRTTSSRWG